MMRIIKFKNGTEISMPDDEFEIDESELLKMAQKILMPNLKENKIIILETPSMKSGFFYDMWKKFEK